MRTSESRYERSISPAITSIEEGSTLTKESRYCSILFSNHFGCTYISARLSACAAVNCVGLSQDATSLSETFRRPLVLAITVALSATSAIASDVPHLFHRLTGAASCWPAPDSHTCGLIREAHLSRTVSLSLIGNLQTWHYRAAYQHLRYI